MNKSFEDLPINSQEFNRECALIIAEIKDRKGSILNLVEDLQPLLTSSSTEQRIKGITILSSVLTDVPNSCVLTSEVTVLANFLCDRLRDHHEVVPAVIKGLVIVISLEGLTAGTAKRILSTIFHHVPCQQQQQADRYNIYRIFKQLHETNKQELQDMGLDLIYGIITAIDSEKDPRNLSFLFDWLQIFLKDFHLGHLSEEMFEVLACYFPVDFRPSSSDTISRDSLARSLSKCLCASQKFGDFIIPLALEKLDSDLTTAKMDSLEVLELASQQFPSHLLVKYSTAIWAPIHREIISARNEELQSPALKTLASFVKCVTSEPDGAIFSLLESMILNVKGNATPDSRLFDASCKIIFATAASKISSNYVIEMIVPLWVNLYHIASTAKYQVDILKVLCELCTIAAEVSELRFNDNPPLQNVPDLFLRALTKSDGDLKSEALKCLKKIARHLPIESRNVLFENLKFLLLLPLENDQRTLVLHCLKEYAKFYPTEIEGLIRSLKTNNNLKLYLETVGSVLETKQLWFLCMKELTTYALQSSTENSRLSLSILSRILKEEKDSELKEYLVEKEDFISRTVDWFVVNSKNFNVDVDRDILDDISCIMYRVIAKLNAEAQKEVLAQVSEKIRSKSIEEVFVIWYGLLVGLKDFELLDLEMWKLFIDAAFSATNAYVNEILSQLIGNLLNKLNDDNVLDKVLNDIESRSFISSECRNIQGVFTIVSFTTKGLVLRRHKDATIWTNKLLELSGKHKEACKSFRIILDNTHMCFSKFCHIKERLLYKQRFFVDVIDYITANCTPEDTSYLTIVAYVVQGVPEPLLHMYLMKVIKWIILYLDISDDNVTICNLCKLINRAIQSKVVDALRYTSEILKLYLKLSTKNPCMKVRIETLKGIRLFTELPLHEIIAQKQDVIKTLNVCVDDRKRLVRKEAMETRLRWYLIDSPM